jgi:hypothetical protein
VQRHGFQGKFDCNKGRSDSSVCLCRGPVAGPCGVRSGWRSGSRR